MDAATTLRHARSLSGLSLRELGERAGTSHATLVAYEQGRVVPRVDTLARILRAAGFSTVVRLHPAPDASTAEREAKGEELRQALDLAAQFPARHAERLAHPPFPGRRSA